MGWGKVGKEEMKRTAKRKAPERVGRSEVRAGVKASDVRKRSETEFIALVMNRVGREVCWECGNKKDDGRGSFCADCLKPFPVVTNVGEPVSGWQYRIVQRFPAWAELSFVVERVDAFPPERHNRHEAYALCDSEEEARALCEKELAKCSNREAGMWV